MNVSVVKLSEKSHARPPNLVDLHHGGLGHGHGHGDSHHHHGLVTKDGHCVGASLRGLMVIIALSLHEILEGESNDESTHIIVLLLIKIF
jgi:hypothetical protein